MGVGESMVGNGEVIRAPLGMQVLTIGKHFVLERIRVVGGKLCFDIPSEGNGYSELNEFSGLFAFLRRYKIDGSQLVVHAPATPIGQFLYHGEDVVLSEMIFVLCS